MSLENIGNKDLSLAQCQATGTGKKGGKKEREIFFPRYPVFLLPVVWHYAIDLIHVTLYFHIQLLSFTINYLI